VAHFAELDNNNVVLRVIVVSDEDAGPSPGLAGEAFCHDLLGGRWKQTSYNTRGGIHYGPDTNVPDGKPEFRKNYAGIGYTYDDVRDAFLPPTPFPSWVLNEDTCLWDSPVPYPTEPAPDGYYYQWNEPTVSWIVVSYSD
jgi:hypothetical protein